jgi:Ca2+-binding EF-hand superfamily protein
MRQHLTTNDKLQSVLDGAVRSKFDGPSMENAVGHRKDVYLKGKRLANLYGFNQGSKYVGKRTKSRAQTSPMLKTAGNSIMGEASLTSPLSEPSFHGLSISHKNDDADTLNPKKYATLKQPVDIELRGESPYRLVNEGTQPWYAGYKNSSKSNPAGDFAKASRYGFKGAMDMSQHDRSKTQIAAGRIPDFLHGAKPVDEWAPKLTGTMVEWPEDSAYVAGSDLRHNNTHIIHGKMHERTYTTGLNWEDLNKLQPNKWKNLKRTYQKEEEDAQRFNESVVRERQRKARDVEPPRSLSRMRKGVSDSMIRMVASQGRMLPPPSQDRKMKYWSNFSLVFSDEQNPEAAASKLQKEAEDRLTRYSLKWKELGSLNKILRGSRKPNNEDITDLKETLMKTASGNPIAWCLSRDQFCKIVFNSHGQHALCTQKMCNRVFSAFDPHRRDRLDTRELVCSLRLLRNPGDSAEDKMRALFAQYDMQGLGTITLGELRVMLLMCVASDDDTMRILKLFNEQMADMFRKGDENQELDIDFFEAFLDLPRSPLMAEFADQLRSRLESSSQEIKNA